jgi:hypothetical protein
LVRAFAPGAARVVPEQPGPTAAEADSDPAQPRLLLTIGLTPEDRHWLDRIEAPERFRYRPLGDPRAGEDPEVLHPREFVRSALEELRGLPERPAGVIACDDYPATLLAAAIHGAAGLPGPSFESILMCAHKGWSRLVQREVVPEAAPRFQLIDPHASYRAGDMEIRFPFWVKPVKSALSYLGFRVSSLAELAQVQARARAELPRYARAFTEMLGMSAVPLPAALAQTTGEWLIAEELMGGRQCTLEGWFSRGRMRLLGIVDSIRLPNRVSFSRFEYPSQLPRAMQEEMTRIAECVMRRTGFDDGIFNIEFFVRGGRPKIIEINPRLCIQFTDLYAKVDGRLTHELLVELASGIDAEPPRVSGRYRVAASFVLRTPDDRIVRRVPTAEAVARVEALYPGTIVRSLALPGERLSEHAQDSYTFRYGLVHLGAESRPALRARFAQVMQMLHFELEPVK